MLFNKNDDKSNERIIYTAKPNMLFGCKKAIFGIVLLAIVLMVSPLAIKFVGKMQVYLISQIELPLTRYAAIAFFVVMLFIIIYIIWQLIGWYSKEYILTDTRVIIKYGVLSTKKNYMPYSTIQDVNSSQSILARLFGVGSVSLFSAYDNNQMELSNISNYSKVEEIIFSHMVDAKNYNNPRNNFPRGSRGVEREFKTNNDYLERNDYYDEFEPITPIGHERDNSPRREYEYYPEDFGHADEPSNKYEYEPYSENSRDYDNIGRGYYDDTNSRNDYSFRENNVQDYREDINSRNDYSFREDDVQDYHDAEIDEGDSGENAIKRHFDKFKK